MFNFCEKNANYYKRQGSAYGILAVFCYVAFTYTKNKVYKPHMLGILFGGTFAYFLGGFTATYFSIKKVVDKLGIIKEYPELEKERLEIIHKCKKY